MSSVCRVCVLCAGGEAATFQLVSFCLGPRAEERRTIKPTTLPPPPTWLRNPVDYPEPGAGGGRLGVCRGEGGG